MYIHNTHIVAKPIYISLRLKSKQTTFSDTLILANKKEKFSTLSA